MKKLFIFIPVVLYLACCSQDKKTENAVENKLPDSLNAGQAIDTSESKTIQSTGGSFQSFIPEGFAILDSASGDLNLDQLRDAILILKNKDEKNNRESCRPLLILTGRPDGSLKAEARNDSLVLCRDCGGIFGDPYEGITIKKGSFSVEHYGGSSWRWTRTITFKYIKEKNNWLLQRDAGVSYHSSNPDSTTEIISNPKDFGKLAFEKFNNRKGF